ncbi:MAG TPA: molybdopterin-synthase adenylyltransferase MoeB [Thermoanaerobaculia bacterium]|nr:molybdopterin-synthase adenylyltransferase MoeB [Thermoanaerobaculia bacterium]
MFTPGERERYARHLILPQIGEEGQRKLKEAAVLVIGAGGLGSPVSMYLAAAGVGRIGLADFDKVDRTNLHRQILFGESNVGEPKLDAARRRLHDMNPEITIETHAAAVTSENALSMFAAYDVIVDGTDNFPTRYLVNDACVLSGKPNVFGSIFRFDGQASVFWAKRGPCYRCLYPEPPPPGLVPSCAEGGVLGVLPGVIGTIQATETIKLITGAGEPLLGRLLMFDALAMGFRELQLRKDPQCAICGERPTIHELIDYEGFCNPMQSGEVTAAELAAMHDIVLIDVREPFEWNQGHLEGARLIPMGQLQRNLDTIPRDRDVVLYCRSGSRSAYALEMLRAAGFVRVRHLKGGILAWQRAGGS